MLGRARGKGMNQARGTNRPGKVRSQRGPTRGRRGCK
jgi:hypothetical protein